MTHAEARHSHIAPMTILIVLLILPVLSGQYLTQVVLFALITAALCGAWNISGGYGGLTSFGHAAFIGIGAYATTIPLVNNGVPGWLGMLLGGALSAMCGYVLSWTICRFQIKGFYFAVSTILLAEILMSIATRSRYLGRGMGVPLPSVSDPLRLQFLGAIPYYYIALGFLCATIVLTHWIERSRLGWYLRATRQSEDASSALGIDVTMVKVIAMTLSAFLTGIGGGIYVLALRYCSPYDVFGIMFSTTLMRGTLLGGRGTVYGPVIGIAMLTAVKEGLTFSAEALGGMSSFALVLVGWGMILCLVAKFLPNGIGPWLASRWTKQWEAPDRLAQRTLGE